MIDIDLARRFTLQYVPPEGQVEVNDVWNFMKTNPMDLLRNSLMYTQLNLIKSAKPGISSACMNGFLAGFALAFCLQSESVQRDVLEAVEFGDRLKGENVVNFMARKKS